MELSSLLEVCSLGLLFLRVLTFRSNSIFPFLAYFVFVKIRFEQSLHTRNYVKTVELQVDDLVNSVHSVQLKQGWVTAKEGLRKVGGIYLVNNYTVPVPVKEQ